MQWKTNVSNANKELQAEDAEMTKLLMREGKQSASDRSHEWGVIKGGSAL